MFLDNRKYGICESPNNFSQMGPGYAQFFRVFFFTILICIFPLSITGALNTFRNLTGDDCKTLRELRRMEKNIDNLKLPQGYKQYYSSVKEGGGGTTGNKPIARRRRSLELSVKYNFGDDYKNQRVEEYQRNYDFYERSPKEEEVNTNQKGN